jgi:tetratricopeptide (TPR) repeat protein
LEVENMEEFIRAQIQSLDRRPARGAPDPAGCLEVSRVARVSVAGRAGLVPGDLLVSVDGSPAGKLDPFFASDGTERREYEFFSPAADETVELAASGIDMGMSLRATPQSAAAGFDPQDPDFELLIILWESGDWENLERLSQAALERFGEDSPASAFAGAAEYELGRRKGGCALIQKYLKETSRNWTVNYSGICVYYFGRIFLDASKKEDALRAFLKAFDFLPSPRISAEVEKLGGSSPQVKARWRGRGFPCDYLLTRLEGEGPAVSYSGTLGRLKPGEMLALCLLSNYRGNGPYCDFMRRYINYDRYFRHYLPELHVVAGKPEREADRPHWYRSEDRAKALRVPFSVLHDRDLSVAQAVESPTSPRIFLVDRQGMVRHEGELEPADLWDALAENA